MIKLFFSAFMVWGLCAGAATLLWDANPAVEYHTNGTEISSNVLSAYKVYQGNASRSYQTNFTTTNTFWTITNFFNGTNFFAVTAYDTDGLESDYSDEVFLVWTNRPAKVMGLRLSSLVVQSAPTITGPWSLESVLADIDVSDGSRFLRLAISAPPPPAAPTFKRLQPTSGSKTGKLPLMIPKRPRQLPPFPPG